ncbi:MAG: DNRLRE domain-containing protein [Verrucomicrobiales bacterium]|nr:DNRLRE domain-containing protein [Verrucomicrobiales bacterium]
MNHEDKIQAALNGELSESELDSFQNEVLNDPKLLEEYAEAAWLNGQLQAMGGSLPSVLKTPPPEATPSRKRPVHRYLPSLTSIAAAFIGAALTWLLVSHFSGERPVYVATIIESEGCQWAGSDLPTAKGSRLQAGKLALTAGMATLRFDSGAEIVIEAPATLEVESSMRCRLIEGSLVAEVPDSAHGFTVDAPQLEVVDLGTRFGLTTNQFGKSHVLVFEGEVEVTREGDTKATSLKTGNALVNGADVRPPDEEILRNHEPARREGWISFEARKDSFVRKGMNESRFGSSPLMMVKETDLAENNRRRGIMSFDLSAHPTIDIESAELSLEVESSGLGFSTLVPDSRFAIYGVIDDSLDQWEENNVTWENLPGVTDAAIIPELTTKLGTFEILRGASAATSVKMNSPEIADYLRNDGNRIATFLIVRETGEYENQGLVHAFATREHPTAKAPTLYLKPR